MPKKIKRFCKACDKDIFYRQSHAIYCRECARLRQILQQRNAWQKHKEKLKANKDKPMVL